MNRFLLSIITLLNAVIISAQNVYEFKVKDAVGKEVSLDRYRGKVLLIINSATQCGFTPQYKELEELYQKYNTQGFEILDFPCNQFGEQAPGTIAEIQQFCSNNFNIHFAQFDKIDVNGYHEAPLYTYLKSQQGFKGFDTSDPKGKFMDERMRKKDPNYDKKNDIKWNFTKFLISNNGHVIRRYEPTDKISDIDKDILKEIEYNVK